MGVVLTASLNTQYFIIFTTKYICWPLRLLNYGIHTSGSTVTTDHPFTRHYCPSAQSICKWNTSASGHKDLTAFLPLLYHYKRQTVFLNNKNYFTLKI